MSFMNTYTSKKFDPMKITVDDVCTEDIAHALSLLSRGGGHLIHFYSVGQHCINCAKEAKARNYSKRVILACLLHDASEAYIQDIIRPVKEHLTNYLEIESMIMNVIYQKYGLSDLSDDEVKQWKEIDDEILRIELAYLMNNGDDLKHSNFISIPDLTEHNHIEIENEYIQLLNEL